MSIERRNIVLTGFMGTGKTTVGRALADRLGYELVDTDELIEGRHGPIPNIFAEHGEGRFRHFEREIARDLADRRGLVVSTGGRMMLDAVNAEVLGATGDVVCLTADVDTIVARLRGPGTETRPMLAGHDVRARVAELLEQRAPSYSRFRCVATDDLSPERVADEIVALIASDAA